MARTAFPFALILVVCLAGCLLLGDGDDAVGPAGEDDGDQTRGGEMPPPSRHVLSLNGRWQVEQGSKEEIPETFEHTVPVPALLTAAEPSFFRVGLPSFRRRAFWYRTTFTPSNPGARAQIVLHRAKYGAAVWLNGIYLGEHLGSYTMGVFDASRAIRWNEPNVLLVRVGYYRDSVPKTVPAAQDREKEKFIPGIWDDVELIVSGTPHLVRVKVEPDIDAGGARVIAWIHNDRPEAATVTVTHDVTKWKSGRDVSDGEGATISVAPGAVARIVGAVAVPDARLWSPEDPFLYVVHTNLSVDGESTDDLTTRFGMREVEWRSGEEPGFFLNGKRYYLRGSNITLHRFFEDPLCGTLPWDESWVRRLLSEKPKTLNWNSIRVSLGRLPEFWYDLADEIGLILSDEFQFWSIADGSDRFWDVDEMAVEYTEWLQESWNHPSIAWWDAADETCDDRANAVIARVRHLDPTRQWENGGCTKPHGINDPIEDHPYFFDNDPFTRFSLDRIDDCDCTPPVDEGLSFNAPGHPYILNEYGWLWIDRDGKPTGLTRRAYRELLGWRRHDPGEYREAYAYVVGGLTQFWRARRGHAGVQHFPYLTYSRKDGATSDNFLDVKRLILESRWEGYAKSAFAPITVNIETWSEEFPRGETVLIPVRAINDLDEARPVQLRVIAVSEEGGTLAESDRIDFAIGPYGVEDWQVPLAIPDERTFLLVAELIALDGLQEPVYSRRKIGFSHVGIEAPLPPY